MKLFQETVLSSMIVYFVRTKIQKLSVQPLILDTSVPQAYVTEQQHPHSTLFLDLKSQKKYTENQAKESRDLVEHMPSSSQRISCV